MLKNPYKMYRGRGNVYLQEATNDVYQFDTTDLEGLTGLKEILQRLGDTIRTTGDKNVKTTKQDDVMKILQYYKLVQGISDELYAELSIIGGLGTYDAKAIQNYMEGIKKQTFPLFFKKYPDFIDFTNANWEEWKQEIIQKYYKTGTTSLQGFDYKKAEELKKLYNSTDFFTKKSSSSNWRFPSEDREIVRWINKYINFYNTFSETKMATVSTVFSEKTLILGDFELKKFDDDVNGKEFIHVIGKLTFTSAYANQTFNNDMSKVELEEIKNNDPSNSVLQVTLTFNLDSSSNEIKRIIECEYTKPWKDLKTFINQSLDACVKEYKRENNIRFDDFQPFFVSDGKRKKRSKRH